MKFAKQLVLVGILAALAPAQSVTTTTVQGTIYNATGAPTSGTLQLSWPAFTTAASQAIAAGRLTVAIGADGFLSVNLAPNQGAIPAGLYYTAIYHLADGTTSTEYWTVPAAPQAALASVRAQVMPAAQAVQAVNKAYVDQAIQQAASSQVSTFGGTLTGPLYLNGDPLIPTQAATKHYVDNSFSQSLPASGGAASGPLTATQLGAVYQADQAPGTDFTTKLQSCINRLDATYGGACDARNFTGSLTLTAPITIATANATIQFPCATIATAYPIVIASGTRNVTLHGCATRGTSSASGSQGGTVFLYSGSAALFQVGDSTYAADTLGFHLDNVSINTTAASAPTAQALAAWRTQEVQLDSLYLLGNSNQTALTLDGTGNYTGGTFSDVEIGGYLTAVNAIGHQVTNSAPTDWLNASTFLRLHIDCSTSNGAPIAGSIGINLQQGDGNTFTGGDVENCGTALHLGPNAQNNTIVGLRNENSTYQVIADPGSSYNNWITGGTMFTGKLTDNGTRNSFLDTFHRSFNALNGDWYGSQQDATITNHFRLGIGSGTERGLLNRYQTDYGYRWTMGLSDASAGEQFYQVLDELNNVYRLDIGQYNHGQSSSNNQTVFNSAGTGAIVLNGSNNAGTGGVVIGSGGATTSTVATIDKSGNAQFTGTLQVGGTAQSTGTMTVRNNADAEVDYYLWPGLTSSQKGSFTYKDYNGNSQWYLVKDTSNNWALNSAIGGLDSFKAYQSTNSGDTYVNASNSSGTVRVNYESGSGSAFNIYGGNSGTLYASFSGANSIKFPGLAAATGHNCIQTDNAGWFSNTGQPCGSGTVSAGSPGQIAYYSGSGAAVSGLSAVPLSAGGTGASDAPSALANLGAVPASGGAMTGPLTGTSASFSGTVAAATSVSAPNVPVPVLCPVSPTDCSSAIIMAIGSLPSGGGSIWIPPGSTIASNILSGLTKPVTFQFFNGMVTFSATQVATSNNIVFQGQSKTATVLQCSGNQICFELGSGSSTNYQYAAFRDLWITGDGQSSGHTSQVLLDLNGENHTSIQSARLDKSGGDGIDLDAHTSPAFNAYIHIQNSEIWLNGGIGINDTGSNSAEMSLVGTSIAGNTSDAIRWNSYQFSMVGGSVENNGGRVWLSTKQYDRQGCSIHGVYFEGNLEDIRIGSVSTYPTRNATYEGCDISGNRFNGANGSGVQTSAYALDVQAGSSINFHGNWSWDHSGGMLAASTATNPGINLDANYSAAIQGTIAYVSGGNPSGTGTCFYSAANGSGLNAQIALNISSGTVSSVTITNPGWQYASVPTSWSYVSASGATCSGTVTTSGGSLTEAYLVGSQANVSVSVKPLSAAPATGCIAYIGSNGVQIPCGSPAQTFSTFSVYNNATLTTSAPYTWQIVNVPGPFTVQRVAAAVISPAAAGCTTPPYLSISDGTNTCSANFNNGAASLNAVPSGTCTLASSATLTNQVTITIAYSPGSGCTTAPEPADITVIRTP